MYFISQITKNKIDNIDANNNEIIGTAMASANSEEKNTASNNFNFSTKCFFVCCGKN